MTDTRGDIKQSRLRQPNMCFQKAQTKILQKWFLDNIHHPYLKKRDKEELAQQTGLTKK